MAGQDSDGGLCGLHKQHRKDEVGSARHSGGKALWWRHRAPQLRARGELTFMTPCFFQLWVSFGGVDLAVELWCLWWDRERLGRAGGRDWCSYPCAKGTLLQPHTLIFLCSSREKGIIVCD